MRLQDYEIRALTEVFGFCTADDDQPYVWFDPCLTVSGRWGDVWSVGLTVVQTLGEIRGGQIMDHREVYVDPKDPGYMEIRFPGVRPETPPELYPPTRREVLEQAAAEAWKVLEGALDPEAASPALNEALDTLAELRQATLDYLRAGG